MRVESLSTRLLRFRQLATHRDHPDDKMEVVIATARSTDGVEGLGPTFAIKWGGGEAIRSLIDRTLRGLVEGQNAYHTERLWQAMW